MARRPDIAFLAWTREDSRSRSLAQALGGEFRTFYDLQIHSRWLVPLRYVLSALRTTAYLVTRRPRAVVIQSPPVPAAALVTAWGRVTGTPVVLDTHPASFERTDYHALMRPLLRRIVPRAAGCIVTTPRLGEQVTRWGGRPVVVHEAPMAWSDRMQPRDCSGDRSVLFIGTFAPDEPLTAVLDAARRRPDVTFQITGDERRLAPEVRRAAPENVRWVGYLRGEDYIRALAGADVVLSLTQRLDSVQRSAYEAVDALRPLVLSDWPHMRPLFPNAVFVQNTGEAIAAGVADALDRCAELSARAVDARQEQWGRWERQLRDLGAVIGDDAMVGRAAHAPV